MLMIALLCSFAGCKPVIDGNDPTQPPVNAQVYTDVPGVEVRVAQVCTENGITKLEVIWSNHTDHVVTYGEPYGIERFDGTQWVSCSKNETNAFITVGYSLEAGKEISKTYTISQMFDVSEPGIYRFCSSCSVYAQTNPRQDCKLWAQFTLGDVKCPEDSKETGTEVQWHARYIRTDGYLDGAEFPKVAVMKSAKELTDYYNANKDRFDLQRKESVYSDTTIGFLDACDEYDDGFFEENYLILLLLQEGSGSVRHEVINVTQMLDQRINISVIRELPEIGTSDMAQWHVILELSRDVLVENEEDVLVYLDGELRWDGSVIEPPEPEPVFQTPPEGTLRSQQGDVALTPAGYHWTVENSDGTETSTIADQVSRPLPRERLEPLVISSQYAETVYLPVAGSGVYEPTNTLGYLVKFAWGANPSRVTCTCWPDTVCQDSSVQGEEIFVDMDGGPFYAKEGGYIYEFAVTWDDTGAGYYGTANYYAYIIGGAEHSHQIAAQAQIVDTPVTGYCGNTQTTLYIGDKAYSFMYGNSVTLTDILVNLSYDPARLCRCQVEYTVDTEFGKGYGINLTQGYARCDKGQADLTQEQIDTIAQIIQWAEATNCQYPIQQY